MLRIFSLKMPASKKDLKKLQQKKNKEAGIGDEKGRIASNQKVGCQSLFSIQRNNKIRANKPKSFEFWTDERRDEKGGVIVSRISEIYLIFILITGSRVIVSRISDICLIFIFISGSKCDGHVYDL